MLITKLICNNGNSISLKVACHFMTRLRGLLGVQHLDSREGLLIEPCKSVHTIGMSIPIDVLFIDGHNRVLRICHNVSPMRMRFGPLGTVNTVELAAGVASANAIHVNDQLSMYNP